MQSEELVLLPGIERSPMAPYICKENLVTRYDSNGMPENRSFTEEEIEIMNGILKPE